MKYLNTYSTFAKDALILEGYVNEIKNNLSTIKSPNDAETYIQDTIDKISNKKYKIKNKVLKYALSLILSMIPLSSTFFSDLANKQDDIEVKEILLSYSKSKKATKEMPNLPIKKHIKKIKGELSHFLLKLGQLESSVNWKNKDRDTSHVGKYAFGDIALRDVGKNFTAKDFIKDTSIWPEEEQDRDIVLLLKKNKHYLRNHLHYIGTNVYNIEVTLSGLLAASHLLGAKTVKDFLDKKLDTIPKDGNKTTLLKYLEEFEGYNMKKLK